MRPSVLVLALGLVLATGCAGKKRDFGPATAAAGATMETPADETPGEIGAVPEGSGGSGAVSTTSEGELIPTLDTPDDTETRADSLPPSADACGDACSGECEPGDAQCSSSTERIECGIDALWGDPIACPSVCVDGSCSGECAPGSTECVTTTRFRECSELGVWSEATDCANACVGAACGGECRPGQTRCASTTSAQVCNEQGQWGAIAACQNACVGDACTGECVPGTTRCSSETQLQTCNEQGQFRAGTACPFACVNGTCGGQCSPGSRRCNPGTGVPQFCSSSGIWQSQAPCPFVCSGGGTCGGECVPGSRGCSPVSGLPQVCSSAGTWQNQQACGAGSACSAGVCECTGTFESCGSECVDLTSDPDHCGECNRSCFPAQGGTCAAFSCTATPIATGEGSPEAVFLSGTHVYWETATGNFLRRVPKAGGNIATIFTGTAGIGNGLSFSQIANDQLYFVNATTEQGGTAYRVMRANLDGSSVSAFSPAHVNNIEGSIGALATSDTFVFYTVAPFPATATTIFRAPVLGQGQTGAGVQSNLGAVTDRINSMAASGNCLYFTLTGTPTQLLRKCSTAAPTVHHLGAQAISFLTKGAMDGTNLFFREGSTMSRIGLAVGSTDVPLTTVNAGLPALDPFDASALYYFTQTGNLGAPACTDSHTLFRAGTNIGAGDPVVILPPPHRCPTGVAADANALYWSNREGGTVMKVGK